MQTKPDPLHTVKLDYQLYPAKQDPKTGADLPQLPGAGSFALVSVSGVMGRITNNRAKKLATEGAILSPAARRELLRIWPKLQVAIPDKAVKILDQLLKAPKRAL